MTTYLIQYHTVIGRFEEAEEICFHDFSYLVEISEESVESYIKHETHAFKSYSRKGSVSATPLPDMQPKKDWRKEEPFPDEPPLRRRRR